MEKKKDQTILDLDSMNNDEAVNAHVSCSRTSEIVQEYNSCILCGSELLFVHVTDFSEDVVFEESSCPSCKIKSKKKAHKLQ